MKEFEMGINEVKQFNMDTGVPMESVHSFNEIIQEGATLAETTNSGAFSSGPE